MKRMNLEKAIFVVGCYLLAGGSVLRADSLNITLTEADQTVVQGTTVVEFDGVISNPSTTDTIYLNEDSISVSSTNGQPPPWQTDDFFIPNTPVDLAPGQTSANIELFSFTLPLDAAVGVYAGDYSIQGGTDEGALDDVGDVNFTVDVTSPVATPEPAILLLLGTGVVSLGVLRRRFSLSPAPR